MGTISHSPVQELMEIIGGERAHYHQNQKDLGKCAADAKTSDREKNSPLCVSS
jgi:hypothetical protein